MNRAGTALGFETGTGTWPDGTEAGVIKLVVMLAVAAEVVGIVAVAAVFVVAVVTKAVGDVAKSSSSEDIPSSIPYVGRGAAVWLLA